MKYFSTTSIITLLLTVVSITAQADRASDVIAAIDNWNASLTETNKQTKYCKMLDTPFNFYRGSNHLFW